MGSVLDPRERDNERAITNIPDADQFSRGSRRSIARSEINPIPRNAQQGGKQIVTKSNIFNCGPSTQGQTLS
jgi:hypothetical protein